MTPLESTLVTKKITDINPLDAIRKLRSAADALSTQLTLHGRLALVEWAEEKIRLSQLLLAFLLGTIAFLCANIFGGVLLLLAGWRAGYVMVIAMALMVFYGLSSWVAWRVFKSRLRQGANAFATTRAELVTDIALIRSKL
jgi:uncharacterized membrane protein YqjE